MVVRDVPFNVNRSAASHSNGNMNLLSKNYICDIHHTVTLPQGHPGQSQLRQWERVQICAALSLKLEITKQFLSFHPHKKKKEITKRLFLQVLHL